MTGETLILDATDEVGEHVRVTAFCQRELTNQSRREVLAEMVKELHLTPAGGETLINAT